MNLPEFIYTVLLKPAPLRAAANALIRALLPAELKTRGVRLCINPQDPVVSGALLFGLYETGEIEFFERILRPGLTVVDTGANIGLYTALAAQGVGAAGRVIALEPDPESFSYLNWTITANGFTNVRASQVAASSAAGRALLHRNPDNRGDSRLYDDALLSDSVGVETVTLDELLDREGVKSIDILKIDVQGAEGLVLAGAADTLRNSPALTIVMEFWPYGLSRTGHDAKALLQTLAGLGFRLFEANGRPLPGAGDFDRLIASLPGRQYTNLIATRRGDLHP